MKHFTEGLPPAWTAEPGRNSKNAAGIPTYIIKDAHGICVCMSCPDSLVPEDAHKAVLLETVRNNDSKT